MGTIDVSVDRSTVGIDREVYRRLFDSSVASESADFLNGLKNSKISFGKLQDLARRARIPTALFFAPLPIVEAQLDRKMHILLGGVSKNEISLNSRGTVRITDVELIIMDLTRKQQRLKVLDPNLPPNTVVGCLRQTPTSTADAARDLCAKLGIDRPTLRNRGSKEKAFDYLVECFEAQNIYVSQSVRNFMPQNLPKSGRLSGMCVRDKKVPFAFLNSGDNRESPEPAGRRILTLMLLGVCVARGKFCCVTYDDRADELITNPEYELVEEILMPASEMTAITIGTLDDVKAQADVCCVTPSALIMRARRLRLIDGQTARDHLAALRDEFGNRAPSIARNPKPVKALRKYNSAAYSRAFLAHLDSGAINAGGVVQVLFQNRLPASSTAEFRGTL